MRARPPAAIRQDHDVGAWVHFLPVAFASIFAFLRRTDFRCPHCLAVFRRDYLPHKVRLGSGDRLCRDCGKVSDDGSREWPELPASEKFRCLFPSPVLAVVIALLMCALIALFMAPRDQVDIAIIAMVVGGFLLPLVPWFAIRIPQVYRSIRRYENEFEVARKALGMAHPEGRG